MKKIFKKKKLIITFILLFIVVIVFIGVKKKNSKETFTSVNLIELSNKSIEKIISVKSTLDGIEKAEVVSPLNYEIVDIKVKEGDIVSKDQVLAILDSEELKKDIIEAENQIELMKLEQQEKLRTMQIEYDKSILQIEELEKDYNQNKELLENEIITEESFEKIKNSLLEAKKAIESYNVVNGKIVLPSAEEKRMEIQKYELDQKKENLEKVYIKSPIDGTVTRVNVNLGRYAKDTEDEKAMFVVENLDKLQMKVYISEFDINKIKPEQDVDIYSDVLSEDSAKGIVARISPTAEQKEANSMERVIPVLINVTEKPANLIAGVLATAKIKVAKAENVFAIPSGALVQDENSSYKIYILNDDNSLKSISVEIGLETDLETEIKGTELTEGMKVVVNPDITFTEGMIVTPNENEME
ncbi:RND family efflux transporter MFP subunit [Sedimentibacter acidaminivorans]|jgi:HlyD family secretion protein|uniref:RND family efflux transporter MFP subunit n=1 Tax=Sedimentibacter acidaminivorans TaxID=913099 RepID=A0ABS4GHT7_9FIRM|nr:efflux RND transporter periplasmic adaptor subunit [Sedimentibacter acidaminivorans]MBP1927219.1 RND family efflux transporter MFP subunit [Sedimentibacter acidaminivorans]